MSTSTEHLLVSHFLIVAIQVDMKCYLIVVLSYIFFWLVVSLHVCSLRVVHILCRRVFKSFSIFKNWVFDFLLLSCKCSLFSLDNSPIPDKWSENIFSHLVVPFHILDSVLWSTDIFNFNECYVAFFFFCDFWSSKKPLSNSGFWIFIPVIYF